jgi:hypothetical protein
MPALRRPLDGKHLTKEQWNQAVIKMVDLGAEVPKEKVPALLDYGPADVDADKK